MASIDADFKTFWDRAKTILSLSTSEKEHLLVWLTGYAPDAVKTALDALNRDSASMQNAPPTNPNPTNPTPPNAPSNAPTPIRPAQ